MQEITPRFQQYLAQIEQSPEAPPLRTTHQPESAPARGAKRKTNRPTELRIGTEVITVTKSNQIPIEVANWILRQGKTLPVIPNILHKTNAGFPLSSKPEQLKNKWFIEVGDSQDVLIQRARRLLDACELHDVALQVVLRDGSVRTA
jgi:hypothetical protein